MQTAGLKIKNTFERITNRLFMLLILALLLVFAADRILPASAAGDGNVYIAGVPANFPPEYYVDADGKPYGFAIDFMDEVAQRSGIQIQYVVYDNFSDVVVALKNGQIDLIPIMGIAEERKAFTDFTAPVETFHIHIFVRSTTDDINNLDDLTGRKVAVVSENQGYVIMAERNGVDLLVYKSTDEALLALISGNADAMVYPDVPLILIARQAGLEARIKTTGESLAEIKRAIAVRKGQPELYAKLDEAVHAFILTPEYEKIYSKWYGAPQPLWNTQRVLFALGIVIVLATAIFVLVHYILTLQLNRKLAKSLAEVDRTHATLQQWGHIIQHAQWGIAVSSSDGKSLAMMNPAFAAMHGFTIEELTGKPVIEVYAPQARPGLAEHIRIAHESGRHSFESLHIRKDGTIFPVQMNVTAVKDEEGELLYRVVNCQDITERKQADAEKFRLAQILESSLNEIYMFDVETLQFSYANLGARQNTGYSIEQLQSMTPINIKPKFTETSFREMIRPLLLGEKKVEVFETVHQRANGTEYPVEVHLQLVESDGTRVFVALINDITERKKTEEELRASQKIIEGIINTIPASVFWKDKNLVYLGCNVAFARDKGFTDPVDVIGKDDYQMARRDQAELFRSDDRQVIESGRSKPLIEEPQMTPQGNTVTLLTSKVPLRSSQGEITGVLGTYMDITERKQTEEALKISQASLEEAQRIAHLGSWEWDAETDTPTWSKELCDILEVDPTQPAPSVAEQGKLYTPESMKRMYAGIEQAMGGRPYEIELERVWEDGRRKWLLARGEPKFDKNGQITGIRGTALDITERKQAGEELHRFREAVNSSGEVIFMTNREGLITFVNPEFTHMYGYTADEVIGKTTPRILKSGLAKTEDYALLWQTIQNRQVVRGEFINKTKDGRLLTIEGSINAVVDERDEIVGFLAIQSNITERKQAEENMRQRLVELEALHTISSALRVAQTRDEALPILLEETLAALETDDGVIWLYNHASDELQIAVSRGWFRKLGLKALKPGEGIAGGVFTSGQPYISSEFSTDPRMHPEAGKIPAGRGGVCLPIRSGASTVGVLFVSLAPPRQITSEQTRLLASLAEMAGATLQRMSLHEDTQRHLGQLQALHNIDRAITTSMDLRMTLKILLEHVTTQLNVDAASVLLLNPHLHTLEYTEGLGFRSSAIKTAHIRLGESFAGRAALERRTIEVSDPAMLGEDTQFATMFANEGFETYYGIPLSAKGQVKGVLEIYHRSPLAPAPEWLEFLETLAGQAAIAIDDMQLFDNLQRSNIELERAYDTTLEGWAKALELRDQETEGHSQRVTEMTLRLARAMGIADAEIANVRRGALLHDMGKMGVPDSILLKPGKLTDEEWVIMRKHPQYVFDMLSPIAYLRPALDIPYCHHEKWDGTGYPRGLKGEQIPLAARIFAIIDVWDALTSDRPYRKAWPEKKVIAHIKAESGAHFDPEVVNAFLEMQLS